MDPVSRTKNVGPIQSDGGGMGVMKCDGVCLGETEFKLTSRGGTGSESKTCKSLKRETVGESMSFNMITRSVLHRQPDRL